MIKFCKEQWDANREKLEDVLRGDTQLNKCDYKYLLALVVENILNPGLTTFENGWDSNHITVVDDGDYQGTLMFLIPRNIYQPSEYEYLLTYVNYGSCSVCDTLLSIQGWDNSPPTEQQLKDYMALCKDLLMNMVKPYNDAWRKDERYETIEGKES